jgi:toxin ParE1/3/4
MIVWFSPSAKADIQAIYDFIARENPTAASRVIAAIETATMQLSQFPLSGRTGVVETTRELVIPRQPYIAVYRVADDEVHVIAVFHAAQDLPRADY